MSMGLPTQLLSNKTKNEVTSQTQPYLHVFTDKGLEGWRLSIWTGLSQRSTSAIVHEAHTDENYDIIYWVAQERQATIYTESTNSCHTTL